MIAQLRIYKQLIELLERKKYSQDLLKKYKISMYLRLKELTLRRFCQSWIFIQWVANDVTMVKTLCTLFETGELFMFDIALVSVLSFHQQQSQT